MKRKEKKVKDGHVKRKIAILNDGYVLNVDVISTFERSSIKKHRCIITTQEMF